MFPIILCENCGKVCVNEEGRILSSYVEGEDILICFTCHEDEILRRKEESYLGVKEKIKKTREDRLRKKEIRGQRVIYRKNKKKEIQTEYVWAKKWKRLYLICDGVPKCEEEGCNITNVAQLSVRHKEGRFKEEYHNCGSQKRVSQVSESIFLTNLLSGNYRALCMNHGQVYERGTFKVRSFFGNKATKQKIKRGVERLRILGGKCVSCGESDFNYLTVNHLDLDEGLKDSKYSLFSLPEERFKYLLERRLIEIQCFNCHILYSRNLWLERRR